MTQEQKNKLAQGRKERESLRVSLKIGEIIIKSYEHGWILKYKGQEQRYYGSLQDLFKNLFDIKLRQTAAEDVRQLISVQNTCLKEIEGVVFALENTIRKL